MANIIDAIIYLVNNPKLELRNYAINRNRANSMGDALEEYIKDIFAQTLDEKNEIIRNQRHAEVFSYLGNNNNPPDSILKDGDAIEVKKIESDNSQLALNSSYPKAKLFADSPMISGACRNCEVWDIKDIIYAVGVVNAGSLKALSLVYGDDYCAEKNVYERIKKTIKDGVEEIEGVQFSETNELGRVNCVDPLGITYLRVRGMWGIVNPFNVFNYIYRRDNSKTFNFMAIINNEKYYKFENYHKLEKLCETVLELKIIDVKIKNPNNPAQLKDAKLITFTA